MPAIFLILLSGGIMLAAAVSDPREVTLRWLRLAGILALVMAGLAAFFAGRDDHHALLLFVLPVLLILGQLAFVQIARRATQRALAALASACAVATGAWLVHSIGGGKPAALAAGCALCAAMIGLALMDMLLGHAYLTASQMTMAPFMRLNRLLLGAIGARALVSIGALLLSHPDRMFWNIYGLYLGTRWLVGILIAGLFVFMAHDCIKRRSTQSATGILYVAGVLIFVGEIIGLLLLKETGLPL